MLPLVVLSSFSALLSTAQALVLPPLPRAIPESTTSLAASGANAPSPTTQNLSDAGAALPTTFAASLATTVTVSPTDTVSADTDDQHGVIQRAGVKKRDDSTGDADNKNEAEEKQATKILPRSPKKPKHTETKQEQEMRDAEAAGMAVARSLSSSANHGPGMRQRDTLARELHKSDQELKKEAARAAPRSPKEEDDDDNVDDNYDENNDDPWGAGSLRQRMVRTPERETPDGEEK